MINDCGGALDHGLYYGSGGTSQQGDRTNIPAGTPGNRFTYDETPIDEVDDLARTHDMTYDEARVKNFYSDPAGVAADRAFVQGLETYLANASRGRNDAITGRAPSSEAIKYAERAVVSFRILVVTKIVNFVTKKLSVQKEQKK